MLLRRRRRRNCSSRPSILSLAADKISTCWSSVLTGILRAVLHALRDRLQPEAAVKLGAQLPIMVRGIYYEGWHMAATPTKERHLEEFAAHILRELPPQFPIDPLRAARGVYEVLWERLDSGEFEKLMAHLPASLRNLQG